MQKPVIKTIFVDFGNVCATFNAQRFADGFSLATKVSSERVTALLFEGPKNDAGWHLGYSQLFELLECGRIPPTRFFHELTRSLDCAGLIDYETFARLWVSVFDTENTALDELLFRLPQQKYLLSNTNIIAHGRYIAECRITRNHFPTRDRRILSYDVGVIKPDPLMYKEALARARVAPEEALFIDDMPVNIDAWEEFGGHGIVYHAGKNSIQELEAALRDLGVLV